jgi:nitroreductase
MATLANAHAVIEEMRHVRQARLYRPDPVPEDVLNDLLEIARGTGSSRNSQPWHFVVVTDKEHLRQLSQLRTPINWMADAPLAIVIVLNGASEMSEAYDEGRVTERLLIGARLLGLGGGTAWFAAPEEERRAKEILGIPAERTAHSAVVLGYPTTLKDHRPNANTPGRKPLSEIVSHGQFGASKA